MGQIIEVKEITLPLLQSLGIKSNKVTYELLIDYYFKKNEFDKIFDLEILIKNKNEFSYKTLNNLLHVYYIHGNKDKIIFYLDLFLERK